MRSAFSPLAREAVPQRYSIPPIPRSLAAPQLLLLLCAGPCLARVLLAVGHARLRPTLRDLGILPRHGPGECRPGASYPGVAAGPGRCGGGSDARAARLTPAGPVASGAECCRLRIGK